MVLHFIGPQASTHTISRTDVADDGAVELLGPGQEGDALGLLRYLDLIACAVGDTLDQSSRTQQNTRLLTPVRNRGGVFQPTQ